MVMVTHDQVEAMTMATRIAVMKQGNILQIGEPETVYREPVNMYVAGFLGSPSMNFIPSNVRKDSNEIVGSKNALRLTDDNVRDIAETQLVVGVRPHDLTITAPTDSRTHLKGKISAVEPLGDRVIVLVDTPEGELTIMESVSASEFNIGDQVGLVCDLANTYVFDADSENRIDVRLGANGALVADGQQQEHPK
jgi:ABC-type sugar transport system ATPase subunit